MINVFYIPKIKRVSGITTWIREIAKKYHDYDITVVYDEADKKQLAFLKQYVRCQRLTEPIKCKKLFMTYHATTKLIEAEETIGTIHTDFKMNGYRPYTTDKVIAVSKKAAQAYYEISGVMPIVCYNPLTIEKPQRILKLISATRLTDKKGKNKMAQMVQDLEKEKIPYLWFILSDDRLPIESENIVYLSPRTECRNLIAMCDYLVELGEDDDAYSYSRNEANSLGVPIITTPLTINKEFGFIGYEYGTDLHEIYNNIPKVNYKPPKDIYDTLIDKTPTTYKKEPTSLVRVLKPYIDVELDERLERGWLREMPISRIEQLIKSGKVEYENIEPKCKYSVSVIIPVYNQEDLIKRCIESIPSGLEIIVVDDCSTDNTREVVKQYKNVKLICNKENKGVGYTFNQGLDNATGDYIVRIDSDDYFYTGQFNHMLEELDGTDMIYYNLEDNNGRILEVTPRNRAGRCGAVKFIRRRFIGDTRCPEIRWAEDKGFNDLLLDKMPTEKFTGRIVYHYNYPREKSLTDLKKRGLL
jgi:hypothetical protein